MSDTEASVKFIADPTGVVEGMRAAAEAVEGGSVQMKTALAGLNAAFEAAMAPLIAFMAILKGGEVIGEAVGDTVKLNKEAGALGRQLGISANEAGQLSMALKQVGGTTEGFSAATSMLTRQIKSNEDGVKAMGLQTRNADGSLRNSKDLMLDAIEVLKGYKEGTDRNLAAQVLFGRGAASLGPILKLNKDLMEDVKRTQEELGLTITTEGLERVQKYRIAMAEAAEVMEAVKVAIGNALMPTLTALAQWFASEGPTVVMVFKDALDVLGAVLQTLGDMVQIMWTEFTTVFSDIADAIGDVFGKTGPANLITFSNALNVVRTVLLALAETFRMVADVFLVVISTMIAGAQLIGDTIAGLISGGFDGAKAGAERGLSALEARFKESVARISSDFSQIGDKFEKIWNTPSQPKEHAANQRPKGDGNNFQNDEKDDKKADLRIKAWENELAAKKAALLEESVLDNQSHQMSLGAEASYWADIVAKTAAGSKERLAAVAKYNQAHLADLQQRYATEKAIGQAFMAGNEAMELADVDRRQALAARDVALGVETNAQKIASDQQFEAERYAIQVRGFEARLALLAKDPTQGAAYAAMLNQKLALDAQYEAKRAALQTQAQVESSKNLRQGIVSVSQSWGQNLAKMATLQQSFGATLKGMWQGVVSAISQALEQMIANWLEQQLMAAIFGKATGAANAMSMITKNAGVAASAAFASIAAIPIVGPAMAPGAAAAAMSGAMAFMPMASAAQGFDVPKGMNPITQLHAEEMVLPEQYADVIRRLDASGGANGQVVNVHLHALDGKSTQSWLDSGGGRQIAKHLASANRNFHRP